MKQDTSPTRVLIDTDADFDDYMAMLYLLKQPGIVVDGITVTGTAAVHLTPGTCNVNNMLTLLGTDDALKIPVCRGAKAPMIYSNTFPSSIRNATDKHYKVSFPGSNPNPPLDDALQFLRNYLLQTPNHITILCIGGGSNWGRLFQRAKTDEPLQAAIKTKIDRIVMLGGNLLPRYVSPGADGNVVATLKPNSYYTNRVAEWNVFVDPLGTQEIFASGVPITLVTLNATSQVPITEAFVEQLAAINNPVAAFLTQILASETIKPGIGSYLDFWDPLAACVLVNPTLITTQPFSLRVEQELDEEDDKSGMLIVDNTRGSTMDVALSADANAVYQAYLEGIAL